MQNPLVEARRVVIKLGTQIVLNDSGALAATRLSAIVAECAALRRLGKEIIVVSSGAVGLGRQELSLRRPLELCEKQACAAVGQGLLMAVYRDLFNQHAFTTAQVLLTAGDFSERQRYLKLKDTFEKLLEFNVIPIVNENDTVSTLELEEATLEEQLQSRSFGDNDKLAALVAARLGADCLIILTNVDGIFEQNPSEVPDAKLIPLVQGFESLNGISVTGKSAHGRGGMLTKIEAARCASICGVHTLITNGLKPGMISGSFTTDSAPRGTLIVARDAIQSKKGWVGFAGGVQGAVVINDGARAALMGQGASLLPVGVVQIEGEFREGQVVGVRDTLGNELGRGVIALSSAQARKVIGKKSAEVAGILGLATENCPKELINRDNLVVFQDYGFGVDDARSN